MQTHLRAIVFVAMLAACSAVPSPSVTTGWRDPTFKGPPFKKVFVIGLSAQSLSDQRGFENLMVSALQSVGVAAVPGWQYVPTDRVPDQATMRAAVVQSGADATLLVRLSGWQTEGSVGVGMVGGVEGVGPNMYAGWYAPGVVSTSYQAATVYTTLFDVQTARPVWTYNPPTYNPGTLEQSAPAFASEVVGMLQTSGLLASR